MTINFRTLERMIRDDGWTLHTCRGSHRQFRHPIKRGRVTMAGKPSDDVNRGIIHSVKRQAGLMK
jgi:predicted RNA binding protein YcfA (HicA-like mRNA interferase family)